MASVDHVHSPQVKDSIEDDVVNDSLQLSTLVEEETRNVILDLLNQAEDQVTFVHGTGKNLPTVEVDGHSIYKPTLVLQLNGNIFLSKDILTFNSTTMIIVSKKNLHVDQVCYVEDQIVGCILSNRTRQGYCQL